ncbi:MAG: hypothetical protein MHM6MM_008742, partial [Cercozoa sp. M6MM]
AGNLDRCDDVESAVLPLRADMWHWAVYLLRGTLRLLHALALSPTRIRHRCETLLTAYLNDDSPACLGEIQRDLPTPSRFTSEYLDKESHGFVEAREHFVERRQQRLRFLRQEACVPETWLVSARAAAAQQCGQVRVRVQSLLSLGRVAAAHEALCRSSLLADSYLQGSTHEVSQWLRQIARSVDADMRDDEDHEESDHEESDHEESDHEDEAPEQEALLPLQSLDDDAAAETLRSETTLRAHDWSVGGAVFLDATSLRQQARALRTASCDDGEDDLARVLLRAAQRAAGRQDDTQLAQRVADLWTRGADVCRRSDAFLLRWNDDDLPRDEARRREVCVRELCGNVLCELALLRRDAERAGATFSPAQRRQLDDALLQLVPRVTTSAAREAAEIVVLASDAVQPRL